jgi:putative ABC transport system permease protein
MTDSFFESAFSGFFGDVRYALRQLWKRPAFTIVAILVLALGLGANAAIFSVVNAVLLQPLPYPHTESLVEVFERDVILGEGEDYHYNWVSPGSFFDWTRDARSVSTLSAVRHVSFNISSKGESFTPQRASGIACSASFFPILGVHPLLGRYFQPNEDKPNAPYVAILSYGFWQRQFAGSKQVVGKQIRLDGNSYNILGVLPRDFVFPGPKADIVVSFDRMLEPSNRASHSNHFFEVIGRLAPGYSVAQSQEEISSIVRNFRRSHPTEIMGQGATVIRFDRYLVKDIKTALIVLLCAVGCLLLIACVNIANLLLTRALGRQRELAIRSAVGASRVQLIRQLLIESTSISLLGAVAGLLVATWASSFLAAHAPGVENLPQTANIQVDRSVLFFTTALALLSGLAAGFFPAIASSRTDLVNSLKDTSRSSTASRSHGRLRDMLVATEVAVSLVLLVAAGLLVRSFLEIQNVRPGFRTDNSVTFAVSLPDAIYKNREAVGNYARRLTDSLRSIPGISSAGLVTYPPLAGHWSDSVFHIKGHPMPPGSMMDLINRAADPGYFQALSIPLLKGRLLTPVDGVGYDDKHPKMGSVLISQSAERQFFKGLDPINQILQVGSDAGVLPDPSGNPYPEYRIVGVVGDVPVSAEDGIKPTFYSPLFDGGWNTFYGIVHSTSNPLSLASAIEAEVHRLDPDIPVHDLRTFEQINNRMTGDRRFSVTLLTLFAGVALLLSAVCLYGVVSYAVTQRTSEIGIRMALGAARAEVSRLILFDGMKPALAGIAIGIVAAFALTHTMKSLLYGVTSADPLTFITVPVILAVVVAFACLLPAVRATRIDPTVALRSE